MNDLALEIGDGEFMVLVGRPAAARRPQCDGRRLESISEGVLRIDERVVNHVPARSRDIAMVFQSYACIHTSPSTTTSPSVSGSRRSPKDEIARSARKAPAFSSRSRGDGRPALSASTPVEVAARRRALGASRRRCGESKVDSRSRETTSGDVEAATRDAMPGDRPLRGGENLLRAAGRTLWRRGRKPQRLPSAGDAAVRRTRDERANGG